MSAEAPGFHRPAPALSEHTREILAEIGGDEVEFERLRALGVV
jgi:crotonobetainyl-CoA:carnitine CoA-transferase CaiB-like acyl-CoA transferase